MKNTRHEVVTKDYPENLKNGIMVCGINFGYGKSDATQDSNKDSNPNDELSFFSDMSVRKSDKFRNRIVTWLSSWDVNLTTIAGCENSLDKSFFQTNWLNTQTENAKDEGKVENLINNAQGFLDILDQRKPSVILLFGKNLIEALNDTRAVKQFDGKSVRQKAIEILGERSGNGISHRAIDSHGTKIRFTLLYQKFGNTQILCFPHPTGSIGVKDENIKYLKPPAEVIASLLRKK